jgi:hypothetical protein
MHFGILFLWRMFRGALRPLQRSFIVTTRRRTHNDPDMATIYDITYECGMFDVYRCT